MISFHSIRKGFLSGLVFLLLPAALKAGAVDRSESGSAAGAAGGVVPGVVVVRIREGADPAAIAGKISRELRPGDKGVLPIRRVFPSVRSFARVESPAGVIDLSAIWFVNVDPSEDPRVAARQLSRSPELVWAEPLYTHTTEDVPNDPGVPAQSGVFSRLRLTEGWTIAKGNRNVTIAVVDGGTKWDHEDLAGNIRVNTPEDLNGNGRFDPGLPPAGDENGVDDDGNGFIDDVIGWNFTNNSNNPGGLPHAPGSFAHGTAVASHFGAVTDNAIGMAGSGWNCSILPVCVASTTGDNLIAFGYQGIVYAYQNGARVINCSWGRHGGYSQFEQDVIDAATQAGALIVAAAGNQFTDNDGLPHLPSGYRNVLAVGATNSADDRKAGFSNYGISVDVFAPGVSIYSALTGAVRYGDGGSGTSYASPLVAGMAGILAATHPAWGPAQLAMQIRMTADPIDAVNDIILRGRLGRGRANLYRALTESPAGLAVVDASIRTPSGNELFLPGDTVALAVTVRNVLLTTATGLYWTAAPRDLSLLRIVRNEAFTASIPPGAEVQLPAMLFVAEPVTNPQEAVIDLRWTGSPGLEDAASFRAVLFPQAPFWLAQNAPVSVSLYSVRAVDRAVVWAAGGSGGNPVVVRSVNGGETWTNVTSNLAGTDLYCIFAVDSLYAWVGTGSGQIYATSDGGNTWLQQPYGGTQSPFINGIWFFDRQNGIAQGDPPSGTGGWVVIRTSNGGQTWSPVAAPPSGLATEAGWNNSFWWNGPRLGWFGTNQSKVWRTTNAGDTWISSETGAGNSYAVAFRDSVVGIAAHDAGVLRRTTDGGATWLPAASNSSRDLVGATFARGERTGWFIDGQNPFRSRDDGVLWTRETTYPLRGFLQHVSAADSSAAWAVASSGEIVRYTAGPVTGAPIPEEPPVPAAFGLEQNYPNPFNASSTIRFTLPAEMFVRLELFDLLGRRVRLLAEGVLRAGTHEVTVDARSMGSGTYFYRLEAKIARSASLYSQVRRLVLIR